MSKGESFINNVQPPSTADIGGTTNTTAENGGKKKKRGGFGLLKIAMSMMRKKKPAKPEKPKVDSSNGNWQKIVGSMRPLHLQDDKSPPPPFNPSLLTSTSVESFDSLIGRPCSSATSSSGSAMSQYASADNLQALDHEANDYNSDEVSDADEVFDAIAGDEMIDIKAEEFINRFYQQMRRQNVER